MNIIMEVSHHYENENDSEHVINSFSNNQMVLHLQTENAHISKQINKIMFVWDVTNLSERNGAIWRHDPQSDDVFVMVIVFVLVRNLPNTTESTEAKLNR
jgi:hypothetical protein